MKPKIFEKDLWIDWDKNQYLCIICGTWFFNQDLKCNKCNTQYEKKVETQTNN